MASTPLSRVDRISQGIVRELTALLGVDGLFPLIVPPAHILVVQGPGLEYAWPLVRTSGAKAGAPSVFAIYTGRRPTVIQLGQRAYPSHAWDVLVAARNASDVSGAALIELGTSYVQQVVEDGRTGVSTGLDSRNVGDDVTNAVRLTYLETKVVTSSLRGDGKTRIHYSGALLSFVALDTNRRTS